MTFKSKLTFVLMVLYLTPIAWAAEITIPTVFADSGEAIVVPVEITKVVGLNAVTLTIEFDPGLLTITTVKKGKLTDNFLAASNVAAPGMLLISLASGTPVEGEGVLANLHITVNPQAELSASSVLRADAYTAQ